jgi:CHAT domain-containing protein
MARIWGVFFHFVQYLLGRLTHPVRLVSQSRQRGWLGYGVLTFAIALLLVTSPFALAQFSEPQLIVQAAPPQNQEGQQLERLGQNYYNAGEFQHALTAFQQAAQIYSADGDLVRQAISLANSCLTYQQLGQWGEANAAIEQAHQVLTAHPDHTGSTLGQLALVQVLDIRGHLKLAQGNPEQALKDWEQTATLYRQLDEPERWGNSLVNQGQALRELGLYQRALVMLQRPLRADSQTVQLLDELGANPAFILAQRLQALPRTAVTVNALRGLGDTLQIAGSLEQAQMVLTHSLELAEELDLEEAIAPAHLSLGNVIQAQARDDLRASNLSPGGAIALLQKAPTLDLIDQALRRRPLEAARRFEQQTQLALKHYEQAAAGNGQSQAGGNGATVVQVQAQLNQLKLYLANQQWTEANGLAIELTSIVTALPTGPSTLEAQLNLAQSLMDLAQPGSKSIAPGGAGNRRAAADLLAKARQQAIALGDYQRQAYALGLLGTVYEQNQQYEAAEQVTIQALQTLRSGTAPIAQAINDAEHIYRWQWQLGRVRKAQGKQTAALSAYDMALDTLTQLRKDLVTSNLTFRFAFRNSVEEPVYLEFVDLLLQGNDPPQNNLAKAREVISLLNQAELTNFLQEPCELVTPEAINQVVDSQARTTAIIYPIILGDRIDVILKLPGEDNLYHYSTPIDPTDVENTIQTLQRDLEEDYTFALVPTNAHQLYRWIVQPAGAELNRHSIDTLVFALTGALQKIPMAALHDGQDYLIKHYAVSEILGLQLDNPFPIQRDTLNILAAGLAEVPANLPEQIRVNFAPLPNVTRELQAIADSQIPTKSLSDLQFTRQNFNTIINEDTFTLVHLATHGQFSSNPQETFLLTAASGLNDGKIAANDLAVLFRVRGRIRPEPIELLILSACETAVGDELATLGIAGTAIRAGARSVIASLWTLDDAPTVVFAEKFYENLGQPNVSKVQALRQAQLALLNNPEFEHPRYWATYILAGTWL